MLLLAELGVILHELADAAEILGQQLHLLRLLGGEIRSHSELY